MPLQEPVRSMVLAALDEAERQLNQGLFNSWHTCRSDPAAFRARRQGVEEMKLRAIAILTGGK